MAKKKGSSLKNRTKGEVIEPTFVEAPERSIEEPVPSITYRRRKDTDTWHSHPDCSNWPSSNYYASKSKSIEAIGKICEECKKLHQ